MNKFYKLRLGFMGVIIAVLNLSPNLARAVGSAPTLAVPSGLSFAEIKITGDEFLILQNNTGKRLSPDELSSYWLYDFNNVSPLSAGVSSSQQQLPAVALDSGQSLLLSSTTRNTCGAEIAGKLSVSLTDSSGFLELVRLSQDSAGTVQQTTGDVVSWSSGNNGQIPNVPTSTKDPQATWYRYQPGSGYSWQPADVDTTNTCQLNVTVAPQTIQPAPTANLNKPTGQPPSTIVSLSADTSNSSSTGIPVSDIGLAAPQITELLPNPAGTGTDDSEEFIELYNSNIANFDLGGFVLQTGITTKHSYTFPAGTTLPGKGFVAFYSADTGLSLSNASGAADLQDPMGNVVFQTDSYGAAKDAMAWALANGKWYWTNKITAGAANIIQQPAISLGKSPKSKNSKASKSAKGAKTASSPSSSSQLQASNDALTVTPIHPWTLAVVGGLAVAYGVYEYRLDLANRFYRLRRHYKSRRESRQAA